jgi:hypothetical protein
VEGGSVRGAKQNEVASINEHYYEAPEKASCSEVVDRAPDFPSSFEGLKREVLIRPIVAG